MDEPLNCVHNAVHHKRENWRTMQWNEPFASNREQDFCCA